MKFFDFLFGRTPQKLYVEKSLEATKYLNGVRNAIGQPYSVFLYKVITRIDESRNQHITIKKKQIEETFKTVQELGKKIAECCRSNVSFDGKKIKIEALDGSAKAYLDLLLYYVSCNIENPNIAPLSAEKMDEYLKAAARASVIDQLKSKIKTLKEEKDDYRRQQLEIEKQRNGILEKVESGKLSDFEIQVEEEKYNDLGETFERIQEAINNAINRIFGYNTQLKKESRANEMLKLLADRTTELWQSVLSDDEFNKILEHYNTTIEQDRVVAEILDETYRTASVNNSAAQKSDSRFEKSRAKGMAARNNAANKAHADENFSDYKNTNSMSF